MTAQNATHPSSAALKAFGLGKLDAASADVVLQHLDACPDCLRVVKESSGDAFIERLRAARQTAGTAVPGKSLSGLARNTNAPASGPVGSLHTAAKPVSQRKPTRGHPAWVWPVGVAGGLLFLLLALWASGVFKVKTPDGVLVVEVNEPNAEVYVDGDLVIVSWENGGKKAEIHVKPGTRKVEVKKDGFKLFGEEVTLEDGNRLILVARLDQVKLPEKKVEKAKDPLAPGRSRKPGERITLELPGGVPMTFAWCPPGTFQMGSNNGSDDEKPVRTIKLTNGFYMGVFPVTQAQWKAVLGSDPSYFKGADRPVEQIAWTDAVEFCSKLSVRLSLAGRGQIRLPTEAEWEYACRAGTNTDYYTGNGEAALKAAGWYGGNSGNETHPVGQLEANQWNLYDMHGNVWEWCNDWYGDYSSSQTTDPSGPASGSLRVIRGGSWHCSAGYCRAAYRSGHPPTFRSSNLGFRAALVLKS